MKKLLSIILAILMIAATVPFAFAAESDGVKTTLDISVGKIVISDSGVTLNSEAVEADPDGYIITGSSDNEDTALKIVNNSGSIITLDLVFENLDIYSKDYSTAFRVDGQSPVVLNILIKGTNRISADNHPAIAGEYCPDVRIINITKSEDSAIDFIRRDYEDYNIYESSSFAVYIDGEPVGYDGHIHKNTDNVQTCKGYKCDSCEMYFGERDEDAHRTEAEQTCKGYLCNICRNYFGEAGEHDLSEQFCKGYFCYDCDTWFGEGDENNHGWYYGWCDYCDLEYPEGLECEHDWDRWGECRLCAAECDHPTMKNGACTNCSYTLPFSLKTGKTVTYHSSFADALSKAADGSEIKLLKDYVDYNSVEIDKAITFDLNGNQWEQPSSASHVVKANVTFTDSVGGGYLGYGVSVASSCTFTGGSYRSIWIYYDYETEDTLEDYLGVCCGYYDDYSDELLDLSGETYCYGVTVKATHTGGTQACGGYQCEVCGEWYGEGTGNHTGGTQTCKGYQCEVCEKWYGEGSGIHTGGTQTCKGYQCEVCEEWYGEAGNHSGGTQTCKGYQCEVCEEWYGEAGDHSGDTQTCKGYKCETCGKFYGEAGDNHVNGDVGGFCDLCGGFIGAEIKAGDTYTVAKEEYIKFVPAVSGTYILSSSGDSDPCVKIFDSNLKYIDEEDDTGDELNFVFECEYTAGNTYYFKLYDYDEYYGYTVSLACYEHQGGTQTCKGYKCAACGEWYGEADENVHDWSKKDGICANGCGEACPHASYTEGVCDKCEYECAHEWGEGVLTRPTVETAGYYSYTCTLCGHSYTEPTKKADTTALNDVSMKVMEYIGNDNLTQEASNEIHNSYLDILKNNGNIFDEFGFVRGDLIEEDQPIIDEVTAELEKIIADADEKIASGEYVKANYNGIYQAIHRIKDKFHYEDVTDEGKAGLEEIKKRFEAMKADENTSAADVAEFEKEIEAYEEELDKGIEDGTLVSVRPEKIATKFSDNWNEKLEAEGLLDERDDFINNQKFTDEALAAVDEIENFLVSLEGTVAENAENLAKLNEMFNSVSASWENCLRGTHNFNDYEVTSPAKCGENAVETRTCWFCGETDEREVEGTALSDSFTKYEETEAPKCGVAGKEVAYCDHGCQTTDEREIPALEHIFLDYVSNGDATCTADGTKTAECANGCGKTDTVTDEGSILDHTDKDGDKLCDECKSEIVEICPDCGRKAHEESGISLYICIIISFIKLVVSFINAVK